MCAHCERRESACAAELLRLRDVREVESFRVDVNVICFITSRHTGVFSSKEPIFACVVAVDLAIAPELRRVPGTALTLTVSAR